MYHLSQRDCAVASSSRIHPAIAFFSSIVYCYKTSVCANLEVSSVRDWTIAAAMMMMDWHVFSTGLDIGGYKSISMKSLPVHTVGS
jgi:hypothetical protein